MEAEGEDIEKEWDLKVAIGLTAPYILSRLCVPLLAAGRSTPNSPGTIINMSSTRAYQSESDHEAYSSVKAGLLGWIHVANENKAADDGNVKWEEGLSKEDTAWHPSGRVGKVEDIAKAVEYLIGNEFVTGQEVVVDGGVGRKMVYPE